MGNFIYSSSAHLPSLPHPQIMTGYYKNEQATRDTFDDDGFFKTGDVAIYDEEGSFNIVDRLKELIKVKGIQVRARQVIFSGFGSLNR